MFTISQHYEYLFIIPICLSSFAGNYEFEGAEIDGEFAVVQNDSLPFLNKEIIEFTTSKIGKKVGSGECWDLAAEALDYAGAKWKRSYVYGRKVDLSEEKVLPGDIIQFVVK